MDCGWVNTLHTQFTNYFNTDASIPIAYIKSNTLSSRFLSEGSFAPILRREEVICRVYSYTSLNSCGSIEENGTLDKAGGLGDHCAGRGAV